MKDCILMCLITLALYTRDVRLNRLNLPSTRADVYHRLGDPPNDSSSSSGAQHGNWGDH